MTINRPQGGTGIPENAEYIIGYSIVDGPPSDGDVLFFVAANNEWDLVASSTFHSGKVKVSAADTIEDYLVSKIITDTGDINVSINNPGGNEKLKLTIGVNIVRVADISELINWLPHVALDGTDGSLTTNGQITSQNVLPIHTLFNTSLTLSPNDLIGIYLTSAKTSTGTDFNAASFSAALIDKTVGSEYTKWTTVIKGNGTDYEVFSILDTNFYGLNHLTVALGDSARDFAFYNMGQDWYFVNSIPNKDIIYKVSFDGVNTEIMRLKADVLRVELPAALSATASLRLGPDWDLYRSAAATARTPGYLIVDQTLIVGSSLISDAGTGNLFIGKDAGLNGTYNVFHGQYAGRYNTDLTGGGYYNYYSGFGAGQGSAVNGNKGKNNTALGFWSLRDNETGTSIVAIGANSGRSNVSGLAFVAIGDGAMLSNLTGKRNFALGQYSIFYNQHGNDNFCGGYLSGRGTSGYSFSRNIFLGSETGRDVSTGSDNLLIGLGLQLLTPTTSFYLNIGDVITGDLSTGDIEIAGDLEIGGITTTNGRIRNVTAIKTANYTALSTDESIPCDTSGGVFQITLPAAPATGEFKHIPVSTGGNALTINGNGKNIAGAASQTLYITGENLAMVYNGTQWDVE